MKIFDWFKNKKTKIKKKSWNDVTLKQYYEIVDICNNPDQYSTFNLIDLIYGVDSSKLPAMDLVKYVDGISFLQTKMPTRTLKKHYTLNGREYDSNCDLTAMSTAQFVDYQNYLPRNRFEELLSVFFLPKGHTYNDGYDIDQVKEDLLSLPMEVVNAASFFFRMQLKMFCKLFQRYLIKTMKKNKVDKKTIDQFKKVDLNFLVSYPTYLLTVMQQMKPSPTPSTNQ